MLALFVGSLRVQCGECPNGNATTACRSSHLTNDAVQEKFDHYGTFEDANKLSMEAFQQLFAGQVGQAR